MRSVLVCALTGLLAAAVLVRPILLRKAKPRPCFAYARRLLAPDAYARLGARAGWSTLSLDAGDQATLRGLIRRPAAGANAEWVVFFPGNDFNQLARGQEMLDYLRQDRDVGLLVFAYRGFDASTGKTSPSTFGADGKRILDALLKDEHVAPERIHVVGFSLGGFVACSATSAAAKNGQRVASLSLLASVTFVEMNSSVWSARLTIGDLYDTLPLLPDLPGPVLLMHGTADRALPIEGSRDMAGRLGARATFLEMPGAEHQLPDNKAALDEVRRMITRSARH